jgi:hypothetical protein
MKVPKYMKKVDVVNAVSRTESGYASKSSRVLIR